MAIKVRKLSPQLLLLGLIVLVVALAALTRDPLSGQLQNWGVNMNLTGFKETSFTTGDSGQESLEAKSSSTTVDIDRSLPTSHEKFITDRQITLNSLYEPTSSPYPEVITNVLNCPTELKPKQATSSAGVVYTLPAGERQNYGVCSADLVTFQSAYGIFDCGERGVFEVRVFTPKGSDPVGLVNSFGCH